MKYRVVKYKPKKRVKLRFETYEPKKRFKEHAGEAVPFLARIGHDLSCAGGFIGFWVSSGFIVLRSIFKAEEKIKKFSFNNKIVEIKVKKK